MQAQPEPFELRLLAEETGTVSTAGLLY